MELNEYNNILDAVRILKNARVATASDCDDIAWRKLYHAMDYLQKQQQAFLADDNS